MARFWNVGAASGGSEHMAMTMTAESAARVDKVDVRQTGTGPVQARPAALLPIVTTRTRHAARSVTRTRALLTAAQAPLVAPWETLAVCRPETTRGPMS